MQSKEAQGTSSKGHLEDEIRAKCAEIADFLVGKNRSYGSSVEKPLQVFSSGLDPLTQIKVRMDDKLSRLVRGNAIPGESFKDTRRDLVGYLILLEVLEEKNVGDGT